MWSDISFLMYSSTARDVLKVLGKNPKTSKMIKHKKRIDDQSLSRTLRKLQGRKLVVCLTPDRPNNRFFKRTRKGTTILKKMKKLRF